MQIILRAVFTLTLLFSTACSHLTIDRSREKASAGQVVTVQIHSFVFGFVPGRRLYQQDICAKSQIETLEMKMDSRDVLIAIVTLGIYVPHRILAVCRSEATATR